MATNVCVSDFKLIDQMTIKFKAQEVLQTRQSYTAYSIKFESTIQYNMSTKRLWE